MKATKRGNDFGTPGGKSRKLECTLHGFGTAIAKKDMLKSLRCESGKPCEQACAYIVIDDFRAGNETLCLRCKGRGNLKSSMADIGYTVSCRAVDIFTPFF